MGVKINKIFNMDH